MARCAGLGSDPSLVIEAMLAEDEGRGSGDSESADGLFDFLDAVDKLLESHETYAVHRSAVGHAVIEPV